jgi:hypothetical protein
VALNELLGTTTAPPWDPGTTQYRANVLALVQELAAKGVRPFLLLPSNPNPAPELWGWWQQIGAVSDLVREVYFNAPSIEAQGPLLGSRALRTRLRTSAVSLTTMGIPAARVGLMLGFYSSGAQGRAGLQPREAWLDYVTLNVLAARAGLTAGLARGVLADELRGLPAAEAQQELVDTAICAADAVLAVGAVRAADAQSFLRLR